MSSSIATDFCRSTNMERRKYDYYRVAFPEKVPVTLDKAYFCIETSQVQRVYALTELYMLSVTFDFRLRMRI